MSPHTRSKRPKRPRVEAGPESTLASNEDARARPGFDEPGSTPTEPFGGPSPESEGEPALEEPTTLER